MQKSLTLIISLGNGFHLSNLTLSPILSFQWLAVLESIKTAEEMLKYISRYLKETVSWTFDQVSSWNMIYAAQSAPLVSTTQVANEKNGLT
jgi:hypothetical protein